MEGTSHLQSAAAETEGLSATAPDEEYEPHPFTSRTPYEPGDDRDIWCADCEYHRDHEIHKPCL